MLKNFEQPQQTAPETSSLEALELKANLNPKQRNYLEKLKAQKDKILQGKTVKQLAESGDLESLQKYNAILGEILEFLRTKETPDLLFITPEGKRVKFELKEQLKYWADFYKKNGVDWIRFGKILFGDNEKEELENGARALCPQGDFEKLKMIVIPAGLADSSEKYIELLKKMARGYKKTTSQTIAFDANFLFKNLENNSNKFRIILTKEIKEISDDSANLTINEDVREIMNSKDGFFKQTGLNGLDIMTYLVWQRDYFQRTGEHLDEQNTVWLTENKWNFSDWLWHKPKIKWEVEMKRLFLGAGETDMNDRHSGCRLAKTIEVNNW